jgi:hypothetical protein
MPERRFPPPWSVDDPLPPAATLGRTSAVSTTSEHRRKLILNQIFKLVNVAVQVFVQGRGQKNQQVFWIPVYVAVKVFVQGRGQKNQQVFLGTKAVGGSKKSVLIKRIHNRAITRSS